MPNALIMTAMRHSGEEEDGRGVGCADAIHIRVVFWVRFPGLLLLVIVLVQGMMPDGAIGGAPDSESGGSRFEAWSGNARFLGVRPHSMTTRRDV